MAPISLAVTSGDTIQVSIRTKDLAGATVEWTRIISRVRDTFLWTFDMGVVDPFYGSPAAMPAGDYCGTRSLAGIG